MIVASPAGCNLVADAFYDPRVDGSIPSLATTFNSLNRMRFPA